MCIIQFFKLPEFRDNTDIDDPKTTILFTKIIQQKPFLKKLYMDFYNECSNAIPNIQEKRIVELGSGGGFIKEIMPHCLTTDILKLPDVDMYFSVLKMPFKRESVDAFIMINVFHHIPNAKLFLQEMQRTLKTGGKVIMIEPTNTPLSNFMHYHFHHEVFDPKAKTWEFHSSGPLSGANGALPWIVFQRDRRKFMKLFPKLAIRRFIPHTPFRFLASGGLQHKQLLPSISYPIIKTVETIVSPLNKYLGMFYTIELEKTK